MIIFVGMCVRVTTCVSRVCTCVRVWLYVRASYLICLRDYEWPSPSTPKSWRKSVDDRDSQSTQTTSFRKTPIVSRFQDLTRWAIRPMCHSRISYNLVTFHTTWDAVGLWNWGVPTCTPIHATKNLSLVWHLARRGIEISLKILCRNTDCIMM